MEFWRPDTLDTNKESPVPGINGLNGHDWTTVQSAGTYHRHTAEPGSSSLMNASPPQYLPLDTIDDEDFRLYLDHLKDFDIGIHDFGQRPFPPTINWHISGAVEDHLLLNSQSENWYAPPQHPRFPPVPPKAHMPLRSSKHGCLPFQSNIAPVQSRNIQNVMSSNRGKRSRNTQTPSGTCFDEVPPRSAKIARIDSQPDRRDLNHFDARGLSHAKDCTESPQTLEPRQAAVSYKLKKKQKRFIQRWYNTFGKGDSGSFLANENVNALATLIKVAPQLVMEYTHQQFAVGPIAKAPKNSHISGPSIFTESSLSPTPGYSFVEANRHLPAPTLEIVEKYIVACHRRRPQTDGRRRVNQGTFRCTYGCGYQTKRPFDWKRHEETHEPQELWLCHLCFQSQDQNPFLVNRRDKFLGHSKSSHKNWDPEAVLEMSKLDFHANFDPQCPVCPERLGNWDERCKHIQQHYEDGHRYGSRAAPGRSKLSKRAESISGEESSNQEDRSDSTDSSDEEDSHQGSRLNPDERDPTGGSGGGSGNTSGYSSYGGGVTGQDNEAIPDTGPYGSYLSMSHARYFQKAFAARYSEDDDTASRECKENALPSRPFCEKQACAAGRMLPTNIDPRFSAILFFAPCQELVQEGGNTLSKVHTSGYPRIEELDATEDERITATGLSLPLNSLSSQKESPNSRSISGSTASRGYEASIAKSEDEAEMEKERPEAASSNPCMERDAAFSTHAVACTFKNLRKMPSFAFIRLHDILSEYTYPTLKTELPNMVTDVYTLQLPPPAYNDSSLPPVSISAIVSMGRGLSQPQALVHVTGMTEVLGKVGMKRRHEFRHPLLSALTQSLCHRCGRKFVAPRLHRCRCSHVRCDKCTVVRVIPYSREDNDLVAIGSHSLPPAYSFQDIPGSVSTGDPLTELPTGNTVSTPVIAESIGLGNNSKERYIEEGISTFNRVHLHEQDPNSIYSTPYSSQRPLDRAGRIQHYDFDSEALTSASSPPLPLTSRQSKRAKLDNHKRLRLSPGESRNFISGRSKQSVHIRQPRAMNDYTTHPKLDSQDLTSRLQRIQKSSSAANDGDPISRITRTGTDETTSSNDSASMVVSRHPTLRKTKTSLSAGSNRVSGFEVLPPIPTSATDKESVEVDVGEFSKPRVKRRRGSNESSKSHKEFQYYGRHANSWLFNDFSISGHVKKGWEKVFSSKSDGDE